MSLPEIIAWLKDNQGLLSLLFSFVVTASTVCYAIWTRSLTRETKRLREAQTDPHISVSFDPEEGWINFLKVVVKNTGQGPAYDVAFSISPSDLKIKDVKLSDVHFLRQLPYMQPGQKRESFLGRWDEFSEKKFSLDVTYRGKDGKQHSGRFDFDFSNMGYWSSLGTPPLHEIAQAVQKIKDTLERTVTSGKLRVEVWTQEEIRQQAEASRRYIEELRIDQETQNIQKKP